MAKRIVVLQKGIEKENVSTTGCCTNAPVGKAAK